MGASFCHVISMIILNFLVFRITLMNHLWKGAEASFIVSEIVPIVMKSVVNLLDWMDMCKMRAAEATD
jgi:D-alanyl-lipoteichoic acid acyltransferase DltB (MBOAT superfamily)